MSFLQSRVIQVHIFRELGFTTILSCSALSAILLFANLSKHSELIFRALSLSPVVFGEFLVLILPLALSFGLPFGFALSVVFSLGKWSADREILALESLGFSRFSWISPVFVLALAVSMISAFAALHWSPIARAGFDKRVKEMIWEDTDFLAGQELVLPFSTQQRVTGGLLNWKSRVFDREVSNLSISIGEAQSNEWHNVRIVVLGKEEPLGVLHAKKSQVIKNREKNQILLFLEKVDFESFDRDQKKHAEDSQFVSFEKWKEPLVFDLSSGEQMASSKTISIFSLFDSFTHGGAQHLEWSGVFQHLSKYSAVAFAPIFLTPLLIITALQKGRKESYANLFIGVLLCLIYFLFSASLGEMIGHYGQGYIIAAFLIFGGGALKLCRFMRKGIL